MTSNFGPFFVLLILHNNDHITKDEYWERNSSADVLAKDGEMIMDGYWSIKEYRADEVVETFHIFLSRIWDC